MSGVSESVDTICDGFNTIMERSDDMKRPITIERITFGELREKFKQRVFAIPEIQRDFVWTKTKICDLLDSIRKHYPIGSFLICRVPAQKARHIRESTVLPAFDSRQNKDCYIVVDGQQRLSVLYSILNGRKISETQRYKDGIDFKEVCLSPKQEKESGFDFYRTTEKSYIRLHEILDQARKFSINIGVHWKHPCRLDVIDQLY